MKILRTKAILLLCFQSLNSFQTFQYSKIYQGIYDGHQDYGYNFIGELKDKTENTITFHKLDYGVSSTINLDSKNLSVEHLI